MDDEPIAFTSAPEPAPEPEPEPAPEPPTPVTSFGPPEDLGAAPRRRRTTFAVVAAIIVFDLLVAAGVWYFLSPKSGTSAFGPVTSPVESALRSRVASEYPGFTVTRVSSSELDYSPEAGGGSDWVYYFDMQNRQNPGFTYAARYYAQLSRKDEPAAYANDDAFFMAGKAPAGTVGSFMHMWPFSHPGETVISVSITWDSVATTQTCVVDYVRLEKTGTSVTSTTGAYAYAYWPQTDTWTQLRAEQIAAPGEDTAAATSGDTAPPDSATAGQDAIAHGDLSQTQKAVAHALPGFKVIGLATHANGEPMVLVRHTKFPGLRMAVEPSSLYPPDPADDMVALFGGDRVRADAFARAWTSAHRGTIIDMLSFDPYDEGDTKLLDVYFVKSVAEVDDLNHEKDVEYRYNPKTHVWTKAK